MERVHVRSAAVATGYTDAASDGFGDGGFLTGDYGAWDADGRLTLRGRVSSFVNVAGRKVQPEEVEQVLRTMPGVARRPRVVAAPDATPRPADRRVRRRRRRRGASRALTVRQFCAARLAPHKIPRSDRFSRRDPADARAARPIEPRSTSWFAASTNSRCMTPSDTTSDRRMRLRGSRSNSR